MRSPNMRPPSPGLALVAVLAGALLAVAEGFSNLGCASTPAVLVTVGGAFGAGAAAAALVGRFRASAALRTEAGAGMAAAEPPRP
jgi:hypothetical protein